MSEFQSHSSVTPGSNRNFGLVIGVVLLLFGIYHLLKGGAVFAYVAGAGVLLMLIGLVRPSMLALPNRLWQKLGALLGGIVAPFIMGIIYFLVVTPTGLILRLFGKDVLNQSFDATTDSYWITRNEESGSMKNQF